MTDVKPCIFNHLEFGYALAIFRCAGNLRREQRETAMEVLNHLFAALGRMLLWVSSVLVLEELTLGGLARLLLSKPFDSCGRSGKKTRDRAARRSVAQSLEADSKAVQGGVSCSQSNT
jgi:hypothetical protein